MKIIVVYIYPFNGRDGRRMNALRFIKTYLRHPAQQDHQLLVVSNGENPERSTRKLFSAIPHTEFFPHDNSGYDIGAFQHVARERRDCDLMVFFGNSAYLRRPGWLKRMADTYDAYGDILYGSMQHAGFIPGGVWPHIRTTGFWMNPILLLRYPILIHRPEQRYPFEHGPDCLTGWCAKNAGAVVVTFNGVYTMDQWGSIPEGFHHGSQSELITGDRLSRPPYYPHD